MEVGSGSWAFSFGCWPSGESSFPLHVCCLAGCHQNRPCWKFRSKCRRFGCPEVESCKSKPFAAWISSQGGRRGRHGQEVSGSFIRSSVVIQFIGIPHQPGDHKRQSGGPASPAARHGAPGQAAGGRRDRRLAIALPTSTTANAMPLTTANPPTRGGSGMVSFLSTVAWRGPRSITFSRSCS